MVMLLCPCAQERRLWVESRWVGRGHQWVFFDDAETSETCAEEVTHYPGCGRLLERKPSRRHRPS